MKESCGLIRDLKLNHNARNKDYFMDFKVLFHQSYFLQIDFMYIIVAIVSGVMRVPVSQCNDGSCLF